MYSKDSLNQYKQTQVQTADRGKLVVMLYEGAIKFIDIASENMNFKTYDVVNTNIQKTLNIIEELQASLDMAQGGQLAERLLSIYEYLTRRLNQANIEKSKEILKEVKGLLEELLTAWKTIASGNQKNTPGNLSGGLSLKG